MEKFTIIYKSMKLNELKSEFILMFLLLWVVGCSDSRIINGDDPEIEEEIPNDPITGEETPIRDYCARIFFQAQALSDDYCSCIHTAAEDAIIEDFCSCVNLEDIDKTISLVNQFLSGLSEDLNEEQRMQALVTWLQSHACIIDARIIFYNTNPNYQATNVVAFSFNDGDVIRELMLNFSTTNRVISYYYDVVTGISLRARNYFTIDKVFDFINSLELEVERIYMGTYVSTMSPDSLLYILDAINAKPYTHSDTYRTEGYLHAQTNQINITPTLFYMNNKAYQADWFKTMNEYKLVERVEERFGYFIRFKIPEKTENLWESKLNEYDFVIETQMIFERRSFSDKSIGNVSMESVTENIDSEINIRMVEKYGKFPRTMQLQCSTKKIYPLFNYSIYTVCRESFNGNEISFKGVTRPGNGLNAEGPATAVIDLGALNNGTYTLCFYNGNLKQTGELVVSSDKYEMNFADQQAFNFTNAPLYRIPEQTIWGTIGFHHEEASSLVQSFISDLLNAGAEKKPFITGFYNEFEIDENGDIVPLGQLNSAYWFAQSFIYHYSGDTEKIMQLVQRYVDDYGKDMDVSIYTNKGEGITIFYCQ